MTMSRWALLLCLPAVTSLAAAGGAPVDPSPGPSNGPQNVNDSDDDPFAMGRVVIVLHKLFCYSNLLLYTRLPFSAFPVLAAPY